MAEQVTDTDLRACGLTENARFDAVVPQLFSCRQRFLPGMRCRVCGAALVVLSADAGYLDRRVLQFLAEHRHDGAAPGQEDAAGADTGDAGTWAGARDAAP